MTNVNTHKVFFCRNDLSLIQKLLSVKNLKFHTKKKYSLQIIKNLIYLHLYLRDFDFNMTYHLYLAPSDISMML